MSELTAELLKGQTSRRRQVHWRKRFAQICDRLAKSIENETLGNYDDAAREIFYIVLSAKTTDAQYRRTDATLSAKFPTFADLAKGSTRSIKACIKGGGLANKKANQLKRIAVELIALGSNPESKLREMSFEAVYAFLTGLPGVGPKSALCIMMWSLNFDVFPVDVNVSRIATRLGAVARGLKHYEYQKLLPPLIPQGRSRELHVALVVHGRTVCLPKKPNCEVCQIADLCRLGKTRLTSGVSTRKWQKR